MIFKIKKGHHYSNGLVYKLFNFFHTSDRMAYVIVFNETNKYIDESIDRFDVNKLIGYSKGYHHQDSYRFGWNCIENKIHIYAYSYIDGIRVIDEICEVETDKYYTFLIRTKNGKVIYTVTDSEYNMKQVVQKITTKKVLGYNLWPYFGGNKTAPKNISIELV